MSRLSVFLRGVRSERRATQFLRPPGPPILFLHIPKTAGTSLRRMLQISLGMNAVYPSENELRRRSDGLYPSGEEVLHIYPSIRPYFCLIGHFFASFVERLPVPHRTAVFLRDPIQRSLSTLAHFHRVTGVRPDRLLDDDEFVDGHIRNYQTNILGAERGHGATAGTTKTLRRAMVKVDGFDFVGLTESFRDSCQVFDWLFGTEISPTIAKENVLRPIGTEFEELVPRIALLVELDHVLYSHAKERFRSDQRRHVASAPVARSAA